MVRTLVVSMLSLALIGCSGHAKPEEAEPVANLFFERLKEANYDKIYDDAAKQFRDQNARTTAADKLKEINSLGSMHELTRLSMTIGKEGDHDVVLPVYSVRFDQIRCEVTLKLVDENGDWKLLGFALRPLGGS